MDSSVSFLYHTSTHINMHHSEEIIVPDTPPPQTRPVDWAPCRVPLHNISNRQQVLKRKMFEDVVSGEEDEDSILTQSKKQRAYEGENSSLAPLLQQAAQEEHTLNFIGLINKPTPKPWIPLRELEDDIPLPIISVHETSIMHRC
ncbi:uncharacterized protein LOC120352380 [Nilaparvata lugens]|uniref:uncharacterized protein LOC120352380 n=1 Tax=Nilaparvata lugens TaxID=108931 RepID=UPI00193D8BB7|nr:uncharacterized protein LOC120352380 [Nilaparvata lugens]